MKHGIISYREAFIDYIVQNPANSKFQTYLGGTTVNVVVACSDSAPRHIICAK